MTAKIIVDNLKCGGCAHTIRKNLKAIDGVTSVLVLPEADEIDVTYSGEPTLGKIKQRLYELGYPERGAAAGMDKITTSLKSFVSCAAGRWGKSEEETC